MNYVNSKRIVHTDLSVKNVMIGYGKVAAIIGFGMAQVVVNPTSIRSRPRRSPNKKQWGTCFFIVRVSSV